MKNLRILMKSSIIVLIAMATLIIGNKTYAADLAVSASGSKVTISSEYTGKVNISVSGGKSSESSVWIEGNSQTVTISDVAESGATVTVTPVSLADGNGNLKTDVSAKSVKIAGTAKSGSTDASVSSRANTTNTTTSKEPTFKTANETVYATGNINIRKSYSADSDKVGSLQTGEKVTRTGVGDNGWSKVTYSGGTGYIKSSLLTTEEPKMSDDKTLKSLEITGLTLDPAFDPEITDYTVTIGKDVEKLDIKAEKNNEKANVEITGNESLKDGDNLIKITVTAEDKTTRIYTINASKKAEVKLGLSSLKIDGYTISPTFSANTLEYKLTILDPNANSVNVNAVANATNAKVEVTGNTNLKQGENVVNIVVKSEDGSETVTYKVTITKSSAAPNSTNSTKQNDWILYVGIGIIVILIICIISIIVKSRRNRDYDDDEEMEDEEESLYGSSPNMKQDDDFTPGEYDNFKSEEFNNFKPEEYNNFKSEGYSNFVSPEDKKAIEDELFGKLPTENTNADASNELQTSDRSYDSYLTTQDEGEVKTDYMSDRSEWNDDDYDRPRRSKGKHSK